MADGHPVQRALKTTRVPTQKLKSKQRNTQIETGASRVLGLIAEIFRDRCTATINL
jgi:hypothetical protein